MLHFLWEAKLLIAGLVCLIAAIHGKFVKHDNVIMFGFLILGAVFVCTQYAILDIKREINKNKHDEEE